MKRQKCINCMSRAYKQLQRVKFFQFNTFSIWRRAIPMQASYLSMCNMQTLTKGYTTTLPPFNVNWWEEVAYGRKYLWDFLPNFIK